MIKSTIFFTLTLCLLAAELSTQPTHVQKTYPTFEEFMKKFEISYPTKQQTEMRRGVYNAKVQYLKSNPCPTCGVTPFSADTQDQIDARLNLHFPPDIEAQINQVKPVQNTASLLLTATSDFFVGVTLPSTLDWRSRNAVTSVKAQGTCGTCWSFATAALLESSLILQGKGYNTGVYETNLSQQYLLKCTPGNSCGGGFLEAAIDKALNGIPYNSDFPYNPYGSSPGICSTDRLVYVSNQSRVSKYNVGDQEVMSMLQNGPIAIAVSATGWESYTGGTYQCLPSYKVNHAVQLVGYDSTRWIIKNSWGTNFGENGFIYVSRNPAFNCQIGIAVHSLYQSILVIKVLMLLILIFLY